MSHLFVRHGSRVPHRTDHRLVLLLLAALLGGCQAADQDGAGRRWIGQTLPPVVDVTTLQLPTQLETYVLQGEMAGERGIKRVALYRDQSSGETVKLALYSLPGGWEDYSAERRVSGHYLQVRNDFGRRLLKRGAQSVILIRERMSEGDEVTPPQAGAIIEAQPATGSARLAFVLSCTEQVFVVISQEGNDALSSLAALQQLSALIVTQLHQNNR